MNCLRLLAVVLSLSWGVAQAGRAPLHLKGGQSAAEVQSPEAARALGEVVAEVGQNCWCIFQDEDNNYWFGSDGQGVFRSDGKQGGLVTRFTTKDGLAHDQVRSIQQHAATGDLLITTLGGVSKFDGARFSTLPIVEMRAPTNPIQGADEGWLLNADDVWLTGAGGPCRYDGAKLYQLKFPKSPLEGEITARVGQNKLWTPYDVWTVYKDKQGLMWFGTGMFGICRFDGRSFDWMFEGHLTEVPGGAWFGFRSIIEDRQGDFWFCNTQFRYRVEPGSATLEAPDLEQASSAVLQSGLGQLQYTRAPGVDEAALPPNTSPSYFQKASAIYFQSVVEDKDGDLWMATYSSGVWRYDGKKLTHYPLIDGEPPTNGVKLFSIYRDRNDDLWLASLEHGPYKFDGTTFERFKP